MKIRVLRSKRRERNCWRRGKVVLAQVVKEVVRAVRLVGLVLAVAATSL
jgi:hypothetical protein